MGGLNQQVMQQSWIKECGSSRPERALADLEPTPPGKDDFRENLASLATIIEVEIIPRLMLVHRAAVMPQHAPRTARDCVNQEEINEFARLILFQDIAVAKAYIQAMRAEGLRLETLYLDLLSSAARRLGEMWDNDLCDFTQVTTGLWRLQQLLHDLSPAFQKDAYPAVEPHRVLLLPAPGGHHTFGLFMVAEFFRRAGWNVWSELPRSHNDLLNIVRSNHFDVIGLSVASDRQMETLADCIRALRSASKNPATRVMVGGPIFNQHPEMVAAVGADITAADGKKAVQAAQTLLDAQETS